LFLFPKKEKLLMTVVSIPIKEVDGIPFSYALLGPMLSPTHDFKIFLCKISGRTPDEVLSAVDEEIQGLIASPKKRSVSFAYLLDLLLLSSYICVPPQFPDRRGPMPEQIKQTLRDLGQMPE
jgi:hypothetical protein